MTVMVNAQYVQQVQFRTMIKSGVSAQNLIKYGTKRRIPAIAFRLPIIILEFVSFVLLIRTQS